MRVFRRPMFRRGGSTGQGIMTGLEDRRRYNKGTTREEVLAKRYQKVMGQPDINQLLIQGGLGLVSGQGGTGQGTLADVASAFRGPTDQFFQQAMANKAAAKKMAIQQAGQEELFSMKNNPAAKRQEALYGIFLERGIEEGYSGAEAERYADYHTTEKERLRQKVGNRLGGILDFDVSDEKQLRKRLPKLRNKIGFYFFDPRDGKYKKLVSRKGQLGFEQFDSIDSIVIGEDTSPVETKSEYEVIDTSAAEVPTEEEIVAKRFP
jgi:hypothetical protein